MDFDDSPAEAAFRQEARAFLEAHAKLKDPEAVGHGGNLVAGSEEEQQHVREAQQWQALLYDNGWAGITWPKEYGGRGGTSVQQMIWNQELAKFDAAPGVFAQGIGMAGPTLMAHGTAAQKERFIGPMLRGDELWCQLFSEPGAGSDLAALSTKAVRDGDEFVVNGQKVWTSSAHYCDWGILLTRTDIDVPKHQGITYFLVDMRSPGIEIRPLRQITGIAHFNEVFLTDVRIPAENMVGELNRGWGVTMTTLTSERTLIGGNASITAADVIKIVRRSGREDDPVVRNAAAAIITQMEILKYMGLRVQTSISQGTAAGSVSSVLKLGYTKLQTEFNDFAMSLAGASGMLDADDDPATHRRAQQFLNQWSSKIGGGTDQVQRNIVGERILGLPGDVRADKNVPFSQIPK
ncbi:MAG: acyl-CoA dehydrogenase [Ilumatobacteraceae bacterium]|nr:acyl-CoA dehydrogenase [Ilumatobacteraceae bacterium]